MPVWFNVWVESKKIDCENTEKKNTNCIGNVFSLFSLKNMKIDFIRIEQTGRKVSRYGHLHGDIRKKY